MPGLRARVAPRVARDERPRRLRHGDGVGRAHAPLPRAPRRRAQPSRGAIRLPLGPPRGDRRRRRRAPPLDDAVPRCTPPARLAYRRVPARSVPDLDVRGGRRPPREAALPRAGRGHRRGALPRDGRVPAAHRCVRRVPRLPRARAREREPRRDRPRGRDRDPAAALRRAAGAPPPPRGRPRGARRRLVPERRVPGGAGARARLPEDLWRACTLEVELPAGCETFVAATLGARRIDAAAADALERTERERRRTPYADPLAARLSVAADQFLVRRADEIPSTRRSRLDTGGPLGGGLPTVVAGYPWFTDWGATR